MAARGTEDKTFKGTERIQMEERAIMASQIHKSKSDKVSWGDSVAWWFEDTYTSQ